MKRTTSRLPWPNANSGTEERLRGVSAHERGDRGKPEFTIQLQSSDGSVGVIRRKVSGRPRRGPGAVPLSRNRQAKSCSSRGQTTTARHRTPFPGESKEREPGFLSRTICPGIPCASLSWS